MPKILIFTDIYSDKLKRKVKCLKAKKEDLLFLTLNAGTYLALKEESCTVHFINEFLTAEDVEGLEKEAFKKTCSIFHSDGKDFSEYRGISLGFFSEFFIIDPLRRALINVRSVERAVGSLEYDRIIVAGTGHLSCAARFVLKAGGIQFESWMAGLSDRFLQAVKESGEGARTRWRFRPFKDLIVESIQTFCAIADSWFRNLLPWYSGRWARLRGEKCLVFPADMDLFPVYESLKQDQWDFVVFGVHYTLRKSTFKDVLPLERYIRAAMLPKTLKAFFHFLSIWGKAKDDAGFKGKFVYSGTNYWALIRGTIKYNFLLTFPRLYLYYLISSEAFRYLPKGSAVIVTSDDPPVNRVAIEAARENGLKSIVTQHGMFGKNVERGMIANFQVAWGDSVFDWHKERDYDTENIYVAGSPRYDAFHAFRENPPSRAEILSSLGLPKDKKLVLILSGAGGFPFAEVGEDFFMIESVADALVELGLDRESAVVIKPHPSANMAMLERYRKTVIRTFPDITMIAGHTTELLYAADLCVSWYSSTLLEAMFFEKPSIVFDHFWKKETVPYVSRSAALLASNADEMASAIDKILNDKTVLNDIIKNQKEFIKYTVYKFDGHSTERFCKLVEMILMGEKPPRHMR
jgi:glycosyltransferase involved in cell wall biosynthesis